MPQKLRVEYPAATYHVMSREDRQEDIFLDDVDRQDPPRNVQRERAREKQMPIGDDQFTGLSGMWLMKIAQCSGVQRLGGKNGEQVG
jgi:hypothetical protein